MTQSRLPTRKLFRSVTAACIAILIAIVAGLPIYVFPRTDEPRKSDVIMILGPPTINRVRAAERLASEGYASTILVSVPNRGPQSASRLPLCASAPPSVKVVCFTPVPFTTRGEALWLRDYAEKEKVDSAIIVTMPPHVSRARDIFRKCFAGTLMMMSDDSSLPLSSWTYQYAYQTAAYVKVLARPGC